MESNGASERWILLGSVNSPPPTHCHPEPAAMLILSRSVELRVRDLFSWVLRGTANTRSLGQNRPFGMTVHLKIAGWRFIVESNGTNELSIPLGSLSPPQHTVIPNPLPCSYSVEVLNLRVRDLFSWVLRGTANTRSLGQHRPYGMTVHVKLPDDDSLSNRTVPASARSL